MKRIRAESGNSKNELNPSNKQAIFILCIFNDFYLNITKVIKDSYLQFS